MLDLSWAHDIVVKYQRGELEDLDGALRAACPLGSMSKWGTKKAEEALRTFARTIKSLPSSAEVNGLALHYYDFLLNMSHDRKHLQKLLEIYSRLGANDLFSSRGAAVALTALAYLREGLWAIKAHTASTTLSTQHRELALKATLPQVLDAMQGEMELLVEQGQRKTVFPRLALSLLGPDIVMTLPHWIVPGEVEGQALLHVCPASTALLLGLLTAPCHELLVSSPTQTLSQVSDSKVRLWESLLLCVFSSSLLPRCTTSLAIKHERASELSLKNTSQVCYPLSKCSALNVAVAAQLVGIGQLCPVYRMSTVTVQRHATPSINLLLEALFAGPRPLATDPVYGWRSDLPELPDDKDRADRNYAMFKLLSDVPFVKIIDALQQGVRDGRVRVLVGDVDLTDRLRFRLTSPADRARSDSFSSKVSAGTISLIAEEIDLLHTAASGGEFTSRLNKVLEARKERASKRTFTDRKLGLSGLPATAAPSPSASPDKKKAKPVHPTPGEPTPAGTDTLHGGGEEAALSPSTVGTGTATDTPGTGRDDHGLDRGTPLINSGPELVSCKLLEGFPMLLGALVRGAHKKIDFHLDFLPPSLSGLQQGEGRRGSPQADQLADAHSATGLRGRVRVVQ